MDSGWWTVFREEKVRGYYEEIRDSYKNGTSIEKTQEKIRKLISHAVRTTEFYKDFPEDTPLEKMPVMNKGLTEIIMSSASLLFTKMLQIIVLCTQAALRGLLLP